MSPKLQKRSTLKLAGRIMPGTSVPWYSEIHELLKSISGYTASAAIWYYTVSFTERELIQKGKRQG